MRLFKFLIYLQPVLYLAVLGGLEPLKIAICGILVGSCIFNAGLLSSSDTGILDDMEETPKFGVISVLGLWVAFTHLTIGILSYFIEIIWPGNVAVYIGSIFFVAVVVQMMIRLLKIKAPFLLTP